MRYAIWAAVSSKAQAEDDKVSIPDQISTCRMDGQERNWTEFAVYAVLGESRTRWINLRDAEDEITNPDGSHPLREMLDAAQQGKFDVLICYHYNRYRDLISPIEKTLQAYRVQMTSHVQWTEPQQPDRYDPLNDISRTIRRAAKNSSEDEVEEFRRRYKKYMPLRISRKGLPKGRISYGYRKPEGREFDANAIPVKDPVKSQVVIKIKDMYIAGQSRWQIADHLTSLGIPTPSGKRRWTQIMVGKILRNRFYCGEVHFGETRRALDPRKRKGVSFVKNPPSHVIRNKGAHIPLWDMDVQAELDEVLKRRSLKNQGRTTHRLSGLLYCGICGARVYAHYNDGYAIEKLRWICKNDRSHINILDSQLVPRIALKLVEELKNIDQIQFPEVVDQADNLGSLIKDLDSRRARLLDGYEAGAISIADYKTRISILDTQLADAEAQLAKGKNVAHRYEQRLATIGGLAGIIEKIPNYLIEAPAQDVNTQLCRILQRIIISPNTISLVLLA
jgi:hypothetical protein